MKLLIFVFLLCSIFLSCKKHTEPIHSNAVLLGYDLRLCPSPACGGLLVTIKNDTAKIPPPYYHINSTLTKLGIDEHTQFPINVRLDYKPDTGIFATYHYILVTHIDVVK